MQSTIEKQTELLHLRIIKVEVIVQRLQKTYSHKKRVMKDEGPKHLTFFKFKRYNVNYRYKKKDK